MSKVSKIYIRPLQYDDAKVSYKWRNDHRIWKHTGSRPDQKITLSMELDWIKGILKKKSEKRFAICIASTHEYIGNVQLTDIKNGQAEFHIFIGEPAYWGKGLGEKATIMILKLAFDKLNLKRIHLFVSKDNIGAIKLYKKTGFDIKTEYESQYLMVVEKTNA
ncbi:MAG: GNAT family N-acetyltransferase [Cryomorphaceae bacterium]|nr:GNAT family N-acetyltransferase [Cryomorphaceae bacterium]